MLICGLDLGRSRELEVFEVEGKGRGVRALENIKMGDFVTEYKYGKKYLKKERQKFEEEYKMNEEGCYTLEAKIDGRNYCFDATRRLNCYGR